MRAEDATTADDGISPLKTPEGQLLLGGAALALVGLFAVWIVYRTATSRIGGGLTVDGSTVGYAVGMGLAGTGVLMCVAGAAAYGATLGVRRAAGVANKERRG